MQNALRSADDILGLTKAAYDLLSEDGEAVRTAAKKYTRLTDNYVMGRIMESEDDSPLSNVCIYIILVFLFNLYDLRDYGILLNAGTADMGRRSK